MSRRYMHFNLPIRLLPIFILFFPKLVMGQGMNHLWKDLEEKYLNADLQVDLLEETIEDSILYQRFYFFSHDIQGEPLNVYAVYAQPLEPKEKLPAVVSVHGGGGTADEETVTFLANRGYAVISYDWTGYRRPTGKLSGRPAHKTTHLPPSVYRSTMIKKDTIELNLFFNSLFIARRAITFVSQQKDVDAEKIGLTGFSWGGSHTFRLNAMDDRIKATVPTYGVYRWGKTPDEQAEWGAIFGAMEYADAQIAPVCYITPTNDLGEVENFDNSQEFMQKLNVPHRQVWMANEDHGVRLKAMEAGYRFFDHYLKGTPELAPSPTLTYTVQNDEVQVLIKAKGASTVDLFYSFGNEKREVGSFWTKVSTSAKGDGVFEVILPIVGGMQQLQIYSQGRYTDAYELSSLRANVDIPENSKAPTAEKILYDPIMGTTPVFTGWANHNMGFVKSGTRVMVRPSVADWRLCYVQERSKDGYYPKGGVKIPSLYRAIFRSLSDPRRIAPKGAKLVIEYYCKSGGTLDFRVQNGEAGNNEANLRKLPAHKYNAEIEANGAWRKLVLDASDFTLEKEGKKEKLEDFTEARSLELNITPTGNEHPEIGKIYWEY